MEHTVCYTYTQLSSFAMIDLIGKMHRKGRGRVGYTQLCQLLNVSAALLEKKIYGQSINVACLYSSKTSREKPYEYIHQIGNFSRGSFFCFCHKIEVCTTHCNIKIQLQFIMAMPMEWKKYPPPLHIKNFILIF